ncbi:MAG: amino acid racemase [Terriglobales bacterium]
MKTIGIVGGIAPESTVEYYRLFIAAYRAKVPDGSYPPILINSINMTKMLDFITANELKRTTDYLLTALQSLAAAGAEIGLLASNTPHIVFDELERRSPIPLVSIVRAASAEARTRGLTRLGLLGTRSTMQGRFYPEAFLRDGIDVLRPTPTEQDLIHDVYMNELVKGDYRPESRAALAAIIEHFKERNSLDGIILGGTELPLLFRADSAHGLPLLDTARIHVNAVMAKALGASP